MSFSRHEHFKFSVSWTFLNILDDTENTFDNVAVHCLVLVLLNNSNRKATLSYFDTNFIEISLVYIIAGLICIV